MMSYYDLTIPFRSLLILSLFLELCLGGCLSVIAFRKKTIVYAISIVLGTICSGTLMVLYTAQARANLRSLKVPVVSEQLCKSPLIFSVGFSVLMFGIIVYQLAEEYRFYKSTITRFSIKEGLDKLTSGLCFYQKGGRVILVNQRMNELSFAIAERDLQNAEDFWKILSGGEVKGKVRRLSYGDNPIFRLPDATVWTFSNKKLDDFYQLTAANTTQVQAVTDELKEKNKELAALNLRLRAHRENVEELTREKERLETRARIHSDLGQALLAARCFLLDKGGTQIPPLEMWQYTIAMLRKNTKINESEQPLDMLMRITETTGITIEVSGKFPTEKEIQKLFVQAAAEALTNAVGHAKAKTLYIEVEETKHRYFMIIRNDGEKPKNMIIEGGGLGALRKRIEGAGGTMKVTGAPEFSMQISLKKERGEIL